MNVWMGLQFCFVLQNNHRPVVVLIRYMLDVAVGMHYIAEKGLVHRVRQLSFEDHTMQYRQFIHRIWLHAMWWLVKMKSARLVILGFSENFLKVKLSMLPRQIYHFLWNGWPLKAWKIANSLQLQMCGVLVSSCGRCTTPQRLPMVNSVTLYVLLWR